VLQNCESLGGNGSLNVQPFLAIDAVRVKRAAIKVVEKLSIGKELSILFCELEWIGYIRDLDEK
jgi:hypothetical protein